MVFSPHHSLARREDPRSLTTAEDYGELALKRILSCQLRQDELMLQFLNVVKFESINEAGGAGHATLLWAAHGGFTRIVHILLDLGIDVNTCSTETNDYRSFSDPYYCAGTALCWAAQGGHADVVELLLSSGARLDDGPKYSPLLAAVQSSNDARFSTLQSSYVRCMVLLLEAGADVNAVGEDGRSVLSWCTTSSTPMSIIKSLLDKGADADVADREMMLPLHHAAMNGVHQETILVLLAKTSDPNALDSKGTSALTWALWNGSFVDVMELLSGKAVDINQGGGIYGTPLAAACRYCSSNVVQMMLDIGADPNVLGGTDGSCIAALLDRPLNESLVEDTFSCLRLLLSHGADPNLRMADGSQALHAAARKYCYHPIIYRILLDFGADFNGTYMSRAGDFEVETTPLGMVCEDWCRKDVALVLLSAGADPNCSTPSGSTPLQNACDILGSSVLALELLKEGADACAVSTRFSMTSLHAAARAARSDVVIELIKHGADVDAQDKGLNTPLHSACWRKTDDYEWLTREKKPFVATTDSYSAMEDSRLKETITLLLKVGGADPKVRDKEGATPLHHAMRAGSTVSMHTLVDKVSMDLIFEQDLRQRLPIHWAAKFGFVGALHWLIWLYGDHQASSSAEATPPKQDLQSYINTGDRWGNTALHYAAHGGHEKFVEILLREPICADIELRNHAGKRALDVAKAKHRVFTVVLLEDAERKRKDC